MKMTIEVYLFGALFIIQFVNIARFHSIERKVNEMADEMRSRGWLR